MKQSISISKVAKNRLKWIEHYARYRNASLTCRHFGISPDTFYHWKRKFDPQNLVTLEDMLSRRPKQTRLPTWSKKELSELAKLMKAHPRAGRGKIRILLGEKGFERSSATIGRMLARLRSTKYLTHHNKSNTL